MAPKFMAGPLPRIIYKSGRRLILVQLELLSEPLIHFCLCRPRASVSTEEDTLLLGEAKGRLCGGQPWEGTYFLVLFS